MNCSERHTRSEMLCLFFAPRTREMGVKNRFKGEWKSAEDALL